MHALDLDNFCTDCLEAILFNISALSTKNKKRNGVTNRNKFVLFVIFLYMGGSCTEVKNKIVLGRMCKLA